MKKAYVLLGVLLMVASVANANKVAVQPIARITAVAEVEQTRVAIPPPPVDAIILLYNEEYMTQEERYLLLNTDYSNLMIGDKYLIWNAIVRIGTRIANSAAVRKVAREVMYTLAIWAAENLDGSAGSMGGSPCPGPSYNPLMNQ